VVEEVVDTKVGVEDIKVVDTVEAEEDIKVEEEDIKVATAEVLRAAMVVKAGTAVLVRVATVAALDVVDIVAKAEEKEEVVTERSR